MPDPAGIGDDRNALQLLQTADADVEIVPSGARESGADLIVQPDLAVPLERGLHRRPQDIVALFVGDPPCRDVPTTLSGNSLMISIMRRPCPNTILIGSI
ncbi:MAG TPA: hypothetical protein VIM52_16785, partial [Stellaceae bacterium]